MVSQRICAILGFCAFASSQIPAVGEVVNGTVVSVPYELTYLLPDPFEGNLLYTFVNGTNTSDTSVNNLFGQAALAPFISYDDEFADLLGPSPQITLVDRRESWFAYEAGIFIPEKNVVWYTSTISFGPTHFEQLNLTDNTVSNLTTTGYPLINPNGGYYFNGSVYFATVRTPDGYPGGIVTVNVNTLEVAPFLNSYFGLAFNDIDDFAFATNNETGKTYLYFTQLEYAAAAYPGIVEGQLANAVWKFDMESKVLVPVIDAGDIPAANGARATLDGKTLYVTNFGGRQITGRGPVANFSSPAVYKYDIDSEGYPVNKRVFSYTRQLGADGIHVDEAGRVWTGEGEGIVVRNPAGKVIGVFNVQYFNPDHPLAPAMANLAIANDEIIMLGTNYLWRVKLAQNVLSVQN